MIGEQAAKSSRSMTVALCVAAVLSVTSASILFSLSSNCSQPMFAVSSFNMPDTAGASPNGSAMPRESNLPPYLPPRQRYAVLSVGTDAKYAYWLPAVALAWKIRQRFTPVIFLVEDGDGIGWRNHTHTRLILDLLGEYGIEHVHLFEADPALPDDRVRLTQLSRLYASLLPFVHDHDFLLTTDVDLLPIATGAGQYFDSFAPVANETTLTGSAWQERQRILLFDLEEFQATDDKWGYRFKEWALSNIGMTALRWRQVLRLPAPIAPLAVSVERHITEMVNEDIRTILLSTGNEWFWDQQLISLRLATAQRTGAIVWDRDVKVTARTNRNRIDRIAWPPSLPADQIDTKFDSHLPRVPDTRGTYAEIFQMSRWLLEHVLNGDGQGRQLADRLARFTTEFESALR